MKPLKEIIIGNADAINYFKSGDNEFFKRIFFNDEKFSEILKREKYFLLGDKGTGKTAYAVYSSTNETDTHKSSLKFTGETDFKKFIRLIKDGKINVSDFVSIWKVILLVIVSQEIKGSVDSNYIGKMLLMSKIDKAINSYYESAFSPEIANAIEIIDKAQVFLDILKEFKTNIEASKKSQTTGMQVNLLEIENEFKKALKNLSLKKNFILYIDGTDQIPLDVKRNDYVDCLRGLANAIWELNQLIFPDLISKLYNRNYLKIVLLIRPDIFTIIRFHNANAKLKDNSVVLSWISRETYWKTSKLYKLADKLFESQQTSKFALGYAWDHYVEIEFSKNPKREKVASFLAILYRTFMRPRDLFAFLDIMHKEAIESNSPKITDDIFIRSQAEFSRYLLGEIKDQFNFFYTDEDWQTLIDFFKYFDGKMRFDYNDFLDCYDRFLEDFPSDNPDIFDTPEELLQELYTYNIIGYIEESADEDFYKWSYKEKSFTNLYPGVVYEANYIFHTGLARSLGIGKPINRRRY
jgi:hypothetical protein